MNAQQQMRWTQCGAHLMLKVRCSVLNGSFERDHTVADMSLDIVAGGTLELPLAR
jgi:hypothetical protein